MCNWGGLGLFRLLCLLYLNNDSTVATSQLERPNAHCKVANSILMALHDDNNKQQGKTKTASRLQWCCSWRVLTYLDGAFKPQLAHTN